MTRRRQRAAGTLAAALFLSACGDGRPTRPTGPGPLPPRAFRPAPRISRTRVLAFGDSLTAGTSSPALNTQMSAGLPQSYPFKLHELLSIRYGDQKVVVENAGKPGEFAAEGIARLATLQPLAPEVVILLHGTNDIATLGLASVARTLAALRTMARGAREAGAAVVLCTLLPQRPGALRAADPVAVGAFNEGLREIARGEEALLVDLAVLFDVRLIGSDGLHPTEDGYARMAEIVFATLRAEFEQRETLVARNRKRSVARPQRGRALGGLADQAVAVWRPPDLNSSFHAPAGLRPELARLRLGPPRRTARFGSAR